jgi:predicted transcriptional regulator of viral defense system
MPTAAETVLKLAEQQGILRTVDLAPLSVPRVTLTRLVRSGRIERIGRGLYSLPGADVSEHHSLVEASKRVTHGVVCLLSALRFHDLTTQDPFEVWIAIDRRARKPKVAYPPLRVVRFSRNALRDGVEHYEIEKSNVPVTSPARTVADCFRYRTKIGLDVAIEALRDYLKRSRNPGPGGRKSQGAHTSGAFTIDALVDAAESVKAYGVLRPYLEALS